MLAAGGADIIVAGITALGAVIGAALGMYGVVYTVRSQKRPKMVTSRRNAQLIEEREARIRAEVERDVWKQIALERKTNLPD